MAWFGIHAPSRGAVLFVVAGLVGLWALIADGPLGAVRLIAPSVHQRGLLVVAVVVIGAPFVAGRATDLLVVIPCVMAGLGLGRAGLTVRRVQPETPASLPTPGPSPAAPAPSAASAGPSLTRLAGRSAAAARDAGAARTAGRLAAIIKARSQP